MVADGCPLLADDVEPYLVDLECTGHGDAAWIFGEHELAIGNLLSCEDALARRQLLKPSFSQVGDSGNARSSTSAGLAGAGGLFLARRSVCRLGPSSRVASGDDLLILTLAERRILVSFRRGALWGGAPTARAAADAASTRGSMAPTMRDSSGNARSV
jgi:hypothetical protein